MRISIRSTATVLAALSLAISGLATSANADSNKEGTTKNGVIYNSVISPLPGNVDSYGFEALSGYGLNEIGNAVNFASNGNNELTKVVVTLSSWGCVSGGWNTKDCVTPEESKFSHPITLNIYAPSTDAGVTSGAKLTSITNTFKIKYRPSASKECVALGRTGAWYDEDAKRCYNGLAQNITFNIKNVKVGKSAIFGIAYNTSSGGYAPIGNAPCRSTAAGCPYDSLNVALSEDPTTVSVGSSVFAGKSWVTGNASWYTDGGAAGVNTFRLDSPGVPSMWGVNDPYNAAPWYVPAIQVSVGQGKGEDQEGTKSGPKNTKDNKTEDRPNIKHN
ncbi:MAG: hypothetical protein NTX12_07730 [Actinobacteria bacterium]|nr:hypothetical protein [Actinomycetota bacterium]